MELARPPIEELHSDSLHNDRCQARGPACVDHLLTFTSLRLASGKNRSDDGGSSVERMIFDHKGRHVLVEFEVSTRNVICWSATAGKNTPLNGALGGYGVTEGDIRERVANAVHDALDNPPTAQVEHQSAPPQGPFATGTVHIAAPPDAHTIRHVSGGKARRRV